MVISSHRDLVHGTRSARFPTRLRRLDAPDRGLTCGRIYRAPTCALKAQLHTTQGTPSNDGQQMSVTLPDSHQRRARVLLSTPGAEAGCFRGGWWLIYHAVDVRMNVPYCSCARQAGHEIIAINQAAHSSSQHMRTVPSRTRYMWGLYQRI